MTAQTMQVAEVTGDPGLKRALSHLRLLVGPAVVLALWQTASSSGWLDPRFVPPPTEVCRTWVSWIFGSDPKDQYAGTWWLHARDSSYRVLVGFGLASVAGVTMGILIGWYRLVAELVDPVLQIVRPIPITAWVPFAVIFFGIHDGSAFFLIALGAFFPIVVNTAAGVQRTPAMLIRAARMLGIRRHMLVPRVVVPAALPSIFTGLRLGDWHCVGARRRGRDARGQVRARLRDVGCLLLHADGYHYRGNAERRIARLSV